ncbi:hypothetical protein HII17_00620 [Thalassotalea sp. M1531]|uniref:Uncharacterized protein n=1 Tax=Thalassotalea algicola TaxID=2716224 RepID=A0A7Y0Q4K3_9GAMM|nr:hypothetical protein [Thalassotalea algicola]NMP30049.1 hypothetical protein [Thalassotalea algicola]
MLNTSYSRFRRVVGVLFYSLVSLLTILAVGLAIFNTPGLETRASFFWLALFGALLQLITIWYLYYATEVPSFARNAIYGCIMLANLWLCLFMFSLKPMP